MLVVLVQLIDHVALTVENHGNFLAMPFVQDVV